MHSRIILLLEKLATDSSIRTLNLAKSNHYSEPNCIQSHHINIDHISRQMDKSQYRTYPTPCHLLHVSTFSHHKLPQRIGSTLFSSISTNRTLSYTVNDRGRTNINDIHGHGLPNQTKRDCNNKID